MHVETADAPASVMHEGERIFLCSDRCRLRFEADPARFVWKGTEAESVSAPSAAVPIAFGTLHPISPKGGDQQIDPVCGITVDPKHAAAHRRHGATGYFFCSPGCADSFDADPDRYLVSGRQP